MEAAALFRVVVGVLFQAVVVVRILVVAEVVVQVALVLYLDQVVVAERVARQEAASLVPPRASPAALALYSAICSSLYPASFAAFSEVGIDAPAPMAAGPGVALCH